MFKWSGVRLLREPSAYVDLSGGFVPINSFESRGVSIMQIGVDSFAASISDPASGLSLKPVERMQNLLEAIELADLFGPYAFAFAKHHRQTFPHHLPPVAPSLAAPT